MISLVRNYCVRKARVLRSSSYSTAFHSTCYDYCSFAPIPVTTTPSSLSGPPPRSDRIETFLDSNNLSDFDSIVGRIPVGSSVDEVQEFLKRDQVCCNVTVSHNLVCELLNRFKADWKSALGVYRWAASRSGYEHGAEARDMIVDMLGKMRQMDQMMGLLEELRGDGLVTIKTVAKAMRRFSGAGRWEDAVRIFDDLQTFGLEKNTESMNLLLDTLCKEGKVEQARAIFLDLKPHIPPDSSTFHIFIFGWCQVNRIEEAYWTIEEMKGHGCRPSVISYSIIIQFYCRQQKFHRVHEIFDEMEAHGCPPNAVTYTTVLSSLSKSERFDEALEIAHKARRAGCNPDTLFYNALINVLGKSGRLEDAVYVFEVEMPSIGVFPNTSTYNTMIAMYCHHYQEPKALDLLKKMETSMFCHPDDHTYYPLLKSCFRTGKIDCLLSQLLHDMVNKHHLSLDISAYAFLIHGLCRANRCEWAYRLFEEMLDQDIRPGHKTCQLLIEKVKLKDMYDAAEKIEAVMKKLKA